MSSLLSIRNLCVAFPPRVRRRPGLSLKGVTLDLHAGEVLGLIGGIGAGKTLLLQALTGLLPGGAKAVRGGAFLDPGRGTETELTRLPARRLEACRRRRLSVLFRDIRGQWNPVMTIRDQIREVFGLRDRRRPAPSETDWLPVLLEVGLGEPERLLDRRPGEVSELALQRLAIALGLLKGADLWIADEPTSVLESTGEDQILGLLRELCRRHRFGLIVATHHFGVIARVADTVAVLFEGEIVEQGPVAGVLSQPRHPYTRALQDCLPRLGRRRPRLGEIDRVSERSGLAGGEAGPAGGEWGACLSGD